MSMKISKTKDVKTPTRGTSKSAGLDFYIPNDWTATTVKPGEAVRIGSGIRAEVPEGCALIAFNKSGVALSGLQIGACVIDEDYQGEINLHLFNVSNGDIELKPGQKLAQFILLNVNYVGVEVVDDAELHQVPTERGAGGFASTGKF
jgi:dUTP pyrophosphatase